IQRVAAPLQTWPTIARSSTTPSTSTARCATCSRSPTARTRRSTRSICPVYPRGLGVFEYDINETVGQNTDLRGLNASLDTLRVIADNTDGRAILNRNDLAVGMQQIIRDASAYYLLGYTSTQAPTDGKFHKIEVKVARRGVDVRARKGDCAFTAADAPRALAPPKPEAPPAVTAAL